MRIIQLLPTLSYGDAVGNDTLALKDAIADMGYESVIYAENIDRRYGSNIVEKADKLEIVNKDDVIIYHLSTGTDLNYKLPKYNCRKIIIYHNITPPEFFEGYSDIAYNLCDVGRKGAQFLADKVDYCLADSGYNKKDLMDMGFNCKIDVLPILIPFEDYDKKPYEEVIQKYKNDGYTNILFTGRVAPNKKQEDVISVFYNYQKYYNEKSRLFIVGNWSGMESYYERLRQYVEALGVKNVIFTGHIPFAQILSYYHLADAFLCMSDHEGFCVPLIEAMHFGIPIIAHDSSVISETLGGAGLLTDSSSSVEIAGLLDRVVKDNELRDTIVSGQNERLKHFQYDEVIGSFKRYLSDYLNNKI